MNGRQNNKINLEVSPRKFKDTFYIKGIYVYIIPNEPYFTPESSLMSHLTIRPSDKWAYHYSNLADNKSLSNCRSLLAVPHGLIRWAFE